MQKDTLQKDYRNVKYEQPYQTAIYNQSMLSEAKRWHVSSYEEAISDLQASQLRAFMPRLLHRCGMECYVTGNYSKQEALHLGGRVETLLKVHCSLLLCVGSPANSWSWCEAGSVAVRPWLQCSYGKENALMCIRVMQTRDTRKPRQCIHCKLF